MDPIKEALEKSRKVALHELTGRLDPRAEGRSQQVITPLTARAEPDTISALRQIVRDKQAMRIDGMLVDLTSASIILQVWDKLNPANRAKYGTLPVARMAEIAFQMTESANSVVDDLLTERAALDEAPAVIQKPWAEKAMRLAGILLAMGNWGDKLERAWRNPPKPQKVQRIAKMTAPHLKDGHKLAVDLSRGDYAESTDATLDEAPSKDSDARLAQAAEWLQKETRYLTKPGALQNDGNLALTVQGCMNAVGLMLNELDRRGADVSRAKGAVKQIGDNMRQIRRGG